MDIRTYPVTPVTLDALRAENERLESELTLRIRQLADAGRELETLRAELDAMRQAHSVIAARMAAMGC